MSVATPTMRNILANAYGTASTYGALFTSDPGGTGTVVGELTGGSPAYARKPLTWVTNNPTTASGTFDVAAATTITYAATCSSISGNTLLDKGPTTSQTLASQGQYTAAFTYTQS